jgi:molybdenum cofactor synthesis domain-containing protein
MIPVEIIVIGNEVLLGAVLDTNSNYLCRVVRGMGSRVNHICVVGDDAVAISTEVRSSLNRRVGLLVTCGGLGPTEDDLTLAAIAEATGRKLELDASARDFVARRYKELAEAGFVDEPGMSEPRLKMARLPAGSVPIENPVGTAPAIALQVDSSLIVALPGVPKELKGIVEGPLQPTLISRLDGGSYREIELSADCGDESVLAPILQAVAAAHPETYIKSRARGFGAEVNFLITISASGRDTEQANCRVESARDELIAALAKGGIEAVAA